MEYQSGDGSCLPAVWGRGDTLQHWSVMERPSTHIINLHQVRELTRFINLKKSGQIEGTFDEMRSFLGLGYDECIEFGGMELYRFIHRAMPKKESWWKRITRR